MFNTQMNNTTNNNTVQNDLSNQRISLNNVNKTHNLTKHSVPNSFQYSLLYIHSKLCTSNIVILWVLTLTHKCCGHCVYLF